MKKVINLFLILTFSLVLTACGGDSSDEKTITIGSKNLTEQAILSKMTKELLEEKGFDVEEKTGLGSSTLRKAMLNGEITAAWDYSGTLLTANLDQDPIYDSDEAFEKVKELDKEQNDIIWETRSDLNNSYTLTMKKDEADKLDIDSMSDLADYVNEHPDELSISADAEFAVREDGLIGIQEEYGFDFGPENIKKMDHDLTLDALNEDQVNIGMGTTTDSLIKHFDLAVLEDDKDFFPAYNAMFGVVGDIYENYPEIKDIIEPMAEELDNDTMIELNYLVDVEGEDPSTVAKNWLDENGLLEK